MNEGNGGFAVMNGETGREARLAMEGLWLTGRILPVGARLLVAHTFRSAEDRPLEVVYAFGLPRDAALRRFSILGEGFRVRSALKPVEEARQEYEQGVTEGHLSTLARVYRDGRVNLSVGNIRPGELVKVFLELVAGVDWRDDGLRFRFPFTLAPCYHRQARAVEIEPGVGEMELPEEEFGDLLLPPYMTDPGGLHQVGFDLSVNLGSELATVASPSHALRFRPAGPCGARVSLSRDRDVPDRDLVLDVRARAAGIRCCGGVCRDHRARFTVLVPSVAFGRTDPAPPRSVVFVLDRSGSMQGTPLEQAKKAVEACLDATSEKDRMGFVAFDDTAELFESALVACTPANRDKLRQHLAGVQARGGTELAAGIQAAVKLAGTGSADLFVITDGQVSASEDILSASRAAGARLHCLGIGAASQDRFLTLLARETGGVSRFVTPRERVDTAALELFASAGRPLASGVEVSFQALPGGRAVLPPATEVFEGHPLVVMGEADAGPGGALEITWAAGREKARLQVAVALDNPHDGETARLLQGARLITDWESRLSGEPGGRPANRWQARNEARILAKLEQLSRDYGLASRAMALVAVVERAGDDASQLPTTRVVPVGMPEDTCFESYFPVVRDRQARVACRAAGVHFAIAREVGPRVQGEFREPVRFYAVKETTDLLLEAAGRLLPDGGLPGASEEDRLLRSTALLLAFLGAGSTALDGPFRLHVQKLLDYLDRAAAGVPRRTAQHLIRELVYYARERRAFRHQPEDWIAELVAWSLPPGAAVWTYLEERFLELV
jgi:Ca-activated chloride channel family protein